VSRRALIERVVRELASYERSSASEGERRAAEWIADELRAGGCRDVRVEEERAHGGYWWPLGLLNAGALMAALAGGRRAAAVAGAAAAAAVYDDVGGGRLWFRRATLPRRPTWNVVAEAGDPAAKRTVVFLAHHDAAHSGVVFHPALPRIGMRLAPKLHERAEQSVPILYGTFLGPLLLALWGLLGRRPLRAAGTVFALGAATVMANIGASRVVPGANDNLSAVAVVVALAHSLREEPPEGVRVLLLSTGSEESFMEGMQAFARRHFPALDRETTEFVCLECVGSPDLCVVEGEGMLRMRHYTAETRERLARAGLDAGVELTRGLRTVAATDGLIALRAGYPTCTLGGVDEAKFPANYHWPTDAPDNLDWDSVEGALAVCEEFVRGRSAPAPA
jgi:Peptidase family M28